MLATSAWLSLANSIGGFTIGSVLMKRSEASKVSSLFHFIPGVIPIMGYFILIASGFNGMYVYRARSLFKSLKIKTTYLPFFSL